MSYSEDPKPKTLHREPRRRTIERERRREYVQSFCRILYGQWGPDWYAGEIPEDEDWETWKDWDGIFFYLRSGIASEDIRDDLNEENEKRANEALQSVLAALFLNIPFFNHLRERYPMKEFGPAWDELPLMVEYFGINTVDLHRTYKLDGIDLSNFQGLKTIMDEFVGLRGADLRGADFSGSTLKNGRFEDADLEGAVFDGANLTGAVFDGANTHNASFRDATAYHAPSGLSEDILRQMRILNW